jgi:phosphatidylglycerophosphate synthase
MATDAESERTLVVLDLRDSQHVGPLAGPLARVCGLPALVRTLLVLERQGYREALVLVRPAQRQQVEELLARSRTGAVVLAWREVPEPGLSLRPVLEALPALPPQLLYWPGTLSFGRLAPELVRRTAPRDGAVVGTWRDAGTERDGPVVLGSGALQARAELEISGLLAELSTDGRLERAALDVEPVWLSSVADTRRAEKALLASLRKGEDGLVARFDRYVSLAASRQLMKLPIHPNATTAVAALVGIACGVLAAQGGYLMMLLGALLFQLNSILDGIDGEIARAKLLESKTGQWLDTISDDICNLAFVVGAGVGCSRTWGSPLYLVLGLIAGGGLVINAAIMYHYLATVAHSGDLNAYRMPWEQRSRVDKAHGGSAAEAPAGVAVRVARWIEPVLRRDFFVLLNTVLALVGQLWLMLWLFAGGATAVWLSIVLYRLLGPKPSREGRVA